jgi:hypothetical protein
MKNKVLIKDICIVSQETINDIQTKDGMERGRLHIIQGIVVQGPYYTACPKTQ